MNQVQEETDFMAENKTKPTKASVAAFIEAVESEQRRADAKVLVKMMQAASGEKPVLWGPSLIGFGSYHYVYESGREGDMLMIGFSPRKSALVLYMLTGFEGAEPLLAKLGKFKRGKSCMYVNKLSDLDLKVLGKLMALAVKAMRKKYK